MDTLQLMIARARALVRKGSAPEAGDDTSRSALPDTLAGSRAELPEKVVQKSTNILRKGHQS